MLLAVPLLWLCAYLLLRWRRAAWAREWTALGVLGLACAGFFWRALLTPGITMPAGGGDYAAFYYPNAVFAARELGQGRFPLWNPQIFGGMPFAADPQQGVFYPPNLLFYLLQPDLSYRRYLLLNIAHYWLASATAYALLRGLGVGRAGALLGGAGYAYSGFMVAHFGHPPMIRVAAWMPLALLGAVQGRRARSVKGMARAGLLAGVALGIAFLGGHTQIWIYGLIAGAALALGPAQGSISIKGRAIPGSVVAWLLALAVAAGISAVQALPFVELAGQSVRAQLSYERSLELALHPLGLIQLVLPKVFGDQPTNLWGPWITTESWGYAGVVTLILAGAALLRPSRVVWTLAALGGLGLLLALGGETPLHGWAYLLVPGLRQARAAGRALYLYDTAVALLAGFGLDTLLCTGSARVYPPPRPAVAALSRAVSRAALALSCFVLPLLYTALLLSLDRPVLDRIAAALRGSIFLALLLAGCALLLWGMRTRRLDRRAGVAGLAALAILDLFSAGSAYNPTGEDVAAGFRQPWATQLMTGEPGAFRVDAADTTEASWPPNLALLQGPPDAGGGWNPLLPADYYRLWTSIAARESAFYDLFAARYLVLPRTGDPPDPRKFTPLAGDGKNLRLYRNERALPRAFVVYRARVLPRDQLWDALHAPTFDPRAEVLLENGASMGGRGKGRATIVRSDPAQIVIQAATDSAAYLLLSDAYYPGWRALVDGKPAPILRANYALRAVALAPGVHTVEFRYRSTPLLLGATISGLTLAAAGLGLWTTHPRRLHRRKG